MRNRNDTIRATSRGRLPAILLAVGLVAAALGCHQSPSSTASGPVASGPVYSYEVRGPGGSKTFGTGSESITASVNQNALEIKGGRLKVNGKNYGALKNGDAVVVESDGQVLVNGEKRTAE